ncbi:MAG: hypothetical protein JKY08_10850 [Flavobacteriaceae bacterium]|nr:hypothetical protein [Flavobacteriaceae bacterium]
MNYIEVKTKKEYIILLNELLKETKDLTNRFPSLSIYLSIENQIIDIIDIIEKKQRLSDNDIYKRYTLGAIAVKNFDSKKEIYGRKLEDIFGALFEYWNMPEE